MLSVLKSEINWPSYTGKFRKSLSDVLEDHYEHRKQQVVDLFDRMLEEFMKDQMNGF